MISCVTVVITVQFDLGEQHTFEPPLLELKQTDDATQEVPRPATAHTANMDTDPSALIPQTLETRDVPQTTPLSYRLKHATAVEEVLSTAVTAMAVKNPPDPITFLVRYLAHQAGDVRMSHASSVSAHGNVSLIDSLRIAEKALSEAVVAMSVEQPAEPIGFLAQRLALGAGLLFEPSNDAMNAAEPSEEGAVTVVQAAVRGKQVRNVLVRPAASESDGFASILDALLALVDVDKRGFLSFNDAIRFMKMAREKLAHEKQDAGEARLHTVTRTHVARMRPTIHDASSVPSLACLHVDHWMVQRVCSHVQLHAACMHLIASVRTICSECKAAGAVWWYG